MGMAALIEVPACAWAYFSASATSQPGVLGLRGKKWVLIGGGSGRMRPIMLAPTLSGLRGIGTHAHTCVIQDFDRGRHHGGHGQGVFVRGA